MQAIGRTKLLKPEKELAQIYAIFGAWLEAAGNTSNSVGVSIEMNGAEEEGIKIDTLGSGVQGLGAAFEAIGAFLEVDSSYRTLAITGNSFISLGSFLEAIGNIYVINEKNVIGEQILLVGSWIQVIGALILINAITLEVEHMEHDENTKNENGGILIPILIKIDSVIHWSNYKKCVPPRYTRNEKEASHKFAQLMRSLR